MSKFKTLVTYLSGRTELLFDKSEREMLERRKALSKLSTVVKVETPSKERERNA